MKSIGVYAVTFADPKDNRLIKMQFSDSPAEIAECDSVIDYSLFDAASHAFLDGGQMDYDSTGTSYADIDQALDDIVEFIFDDVTPVSAGPVEIDPNDLED